MGGMQTGTFTQGQGGMSAATGPNPGMGGKPGGGGGIANTSPGSKPGGQLPGQAPVGGSSFGGSALPPMPAGGYNFGDSNDINPVPGGWSGGFGTHGFRGVDHPSGAIGRGMVPYSQIKAPTMRTLNQDQQQAQPPGGAGSTTAQTF